MKAKQARGRRRTLRRYSAEERKQLIEAYRESGLSQAEFCRRRRVKLNTFTGWLRKERETTPVFAEMTVPIKTAGIEIELPNHVRVRLEYGGDPAKTGALIRAIAGCNVEAGSC